MLRKRPIGFILSTLIALCASVIILILFYYNYLISAENVTGIVTDDAMKNAASLAGQIEKVLINTQKITENAAYFIQSNDYSENKVKSLLKGIVRNNNEIYGSALAFEPYSFKPDIELFGPYYYRNAGEIKYLDLSVSDYYYPDWDWYKTPRKLMKPIWSEPYFDEGAGDVMMTTYSVPLFNNNKVIGVLTSDISLDWMRNLLDSLELYKTGFAFLISKEGNILSHPRKDIIMTESIFSFAEKFDDEQLKVIAKEMLGGKQGSVEYDSKAFDVEGILCHYPLNSCGWSLALVIPEDEFMEPVHELNKIIVILAAIGILLIAAFTTFISRIITRPLNIAIKSAESIAVGKMDEANKISDEFTSKIHLNDSEESKSKNEIVRLFCAVRKMSGNLDSLLSQVHNSGAQVTDAALKISSLARDLEATASEQAASSNEVNTTSKEISATATELALSMSKVAKSASGISDKAGIGIQGLSEIKNSMNELIQNSELILEKLNEINTRTAGISQVIDTITRVANQTNLLSLNAAIEAEKAGEYGTGFAVVAREIRQLADQTAVAALDIEEMINDTQNSVSDGVKTVENYARRTSESLEKMADISLELEEAITRTRDIEPEFELVDNGMQMQSMGAGQISEAIGQLNEVAVQTRDYLIDFNKATELLNDAVRGLQTEMDKFTTSV